MPKISFMIGVSALALAAQGAAAESQSTAADPASPTTPTADTSVEVPAIVVTGIRRSIEDAIQTKRIATGVVDSISAQDIGKLPDQNVVDTLSRIPGVQITRRNGEGQNFTIRGITLNNVLVNGRSYVGATAELADRGPSSAALDVLSSDIVASIDVIKTPAADDIEGALGGTVNLKTKRPLDLPDNTFALRAQGQHADNRDGVGFRGSALASKRFFDDSVGVLVNVAYQSLVSEQQLFDLSNYTATNNVDGNGDGLNDSGLFRPTRLAVMRLPRKVDRLTVNAALEFRPTDSLAINLEGTYNDFSDRAGSQRFQTLLNDNDVGAVADANRTVVSGQFTGITQRPLVFEEFDKSEVLLLGAKAAWKDKGWSIVADASYARGKSPLLGNSTTPVVVPRAGRTVNARYDLSGGTDIPSYSLTGNFDVNDPANYQLAAIVDGYNTVENDSTAARLDVGRELDSGILSKLSFGYRYEDRSFHTERYDAAISLATAITRADRNGDGVVTADEIPGLTYTGTNSRDVLSGLSGAYPRHFLGGTLDTAAMRAGFNYTPQRSPTQSNDVGQKSHSFYAKVDLNGDIFGLPFRGNFGGRLVDVKRQATGFVANPAGGVLPVNYDKKYSQFLPSATLVFDLTDEMIFRVSAARVLASPPLSDLAPGITVNIVSGTGTGGNPLLDPYRAEQADASLEWYFAPSSLLAVSLFTKNVKSFTQITVISETIPGFVNPNGGGGTFLIARPQNGADGRVRGIEVNYQHALTFLPAPLDGLGVQANYTYADGTTPSIDPLTQQRLPFPTLSKHSYSIISYYEKGPVQARLAYTRRSSYLFATQGAASGGSRYVDDQDQLDGSISFAVTPQVKFTVDAQNLLKGPEIRYDGIRSRVSSVRLDDRRIFFGVSAAF